MSRRDMNQLTRLVSQASWCLDFVPRLLRRILDEDMWRDFQDEVTDEIKHYDSFADFCQDYLGQDVKELKAFCRDDVELVTRLENM